MESACFESRKSKTHFFNKIFIFFDDSSVSKENWLSLDIPSKKRICELKDPKLLLKLVFFGYVFFFPGKQSHFWCSLAFSLQRG